MKKHNLFELSKYEVVKIIIKNYILCFCYLYIFYNNFLFSTFTSLVSIAMYRNDKEKIINLKKEKMLLQFKEFLHSYLISTSSGDNAANALESSYNELVSLYSKEEPILEFVTNIKINFFLTGSISKSFLESAKNTQVKEIIDFANAYEICNMSGGNIGTLLKNTIEILNNKIKLKNQIRDLFAEKVFETKIISLMPLFMMFILKLSAKEYIMSFYTSIIGYIIITIVVILNALGYKLADRMVYKFEKVR